MREDSKPDRRIQVNGAVGWISLAVGVASGLMLGLWSFDGPVAVPRWLGEYNDTSRRLARLGHIAFFGVGIMNILLAAELNRLGLGARWRHTAAVAMNFGNVMLPLSLLAAAAYHPLKYFMPVPALAVFLALAIVAGAVSGQLKEPPSANS